MNELKNRGVQDILIAVVDGLKGFPEAITAAFPEATVQTCIVHLIRHSMNFCSWKDRKAQSSGKQSPGLFSDPPHTADLRPIYEAPTAEEAARRLNDFEERWAGNRRSAPAKYPSIAPAWRRAWAEVTPFFAFSTAIRKIIYTTNAVESLNRPRQGNGPPDRFLILLDAENPQDQGLILHRGGSDQADLPGHPQLREGRPRGPGMGCRPQSAGHNVRRAL